MATLEHSLENSTCISEPQILHFEHTNQRNQISITLFIMFPIKTETYRWKIKLID